MTPTVSDRFPHVIYEYRYLSLAGRAWNHFGPDGTNADQTAANALQPGIAVLIQDSLLSHARLLIDFYTKTPQASSDTNIYLLDFSLGPLSAALTAKLTPYKRPIEVHLLHMTLWRDPNYRLQLGDTSDGQARQRLDWNVENRKIVDLLLQALHEISKPQDSAWHQPFRHLHDSCQAVLRDQVADLPAELLEPADIKQYLVSLGLA